MIGLLTCPWCDSAETDFEESDEFEATRRVCKKCGACGPFVDGTGETERVEADYLWNARVSYRRLVDALWAASACFRDYERQHQAKLPDIDTPIAARVVIEQVRRNREMAEMCEAAILQPPISVTKQDD